MKLENIVSRTKAKLVTALIGVSSVFAGCDGEGLFFPIEDVGTDGYSNKCIHDGEGLSFSSVDNIEVIDLGKCIHDGEDLGSFYPIENNAKVNDSSAFISPDTHSTYNYNDYNSSRYTIIPIPGEPIVRWKERMVAIKWPNNQESQLQYGKHPIPGSGEKRIRHLNIRQVQRGVSKPLSNIHIPVDPLFLATEIVSGHYAQINLMSYHLQQYGSYRNLIDRQNSYAQGQNTPVLGVNYYPQMNEHLNQYRRYYNQTRFTP